jgi:DNA invertase Pin-like site-specific DNA recombinase
VDTGKHQWTKRGELQNRRLQVRFLSHLPRFSLISCGLEPLSLSQLTAVVTAVRGGDTLVVWRLDRLGRSLKHLIETITALHECSIGFRSLTESIDTTTSAGKLVLHIFGALAEFERDPIRKRTQTVLAAARARGRHGGGPRAEALNTPRKLARRCTADNSRSIADICRALHSSRATLYRYTTPRA